MKIIESREVYSSPIFRVTEDRAIDPDGFEIFRGIVQHGGSAVMMAVDARGRILLVRQYRLPAKSYLWELPAGRIDPGETALQAARRELKEETGFRARKWTKLLSFYPSPGFLAEKMTVYAAQELTPGESAQMEDERINSRWFTLAEIDDWIRKGKIADGKTIAAVRTWEREKRRK